MQNEKPDRSTDFIGEQIQEVRQNIKKNDDIVLLTIQVTEILVKNFTEKKERQPDYDYYQAVADVTRFYANQKMLNLTRWRNSK